MATGAKVRVRRSRNIVPVSARRRQRRNEVVDLVRFCHGHNTREGSIECLKDLLSEASAKYFVAHPPAAFVFLPWLPWKWGSESLEVAVGSDQDG